MSIITNQETQISNFFEIKRRRVLKNKENGDLKKNVKTKPINCWTQEDFSQVEVQSA